MHIRRADINAGTSAVRMPVALLLIVLTIGTSGARGADLIQAHSLVPPILESYWMSGMHYWSFGRQTVITDRFIELTNMNQFSDGYLWNLLDVQLTRFELSVILHFSGMSKMWFADGEGSGVGMWYATTDKVNYMSGSKILGFKDVFIGVGVLVEHNSVITIVKSDSSIQQTLDGLKKNKLGSCTIPDLNNHYIKIILSYVHDMLSVRYSEMDSPKDEPSALELCMSVPMSFPPGGYHFGLTAANNPKSQAIHKVYAIQMMSSDINDTRTDNAFRHHA